MATVKKFLDDMSGQSEAQAKAEKELGLLTQMANYKLDALEARILDQFRNKEVAGKIEVVGDRLGEFTRDYRVNYQDGDVSAAVNGIVDELMSIGEKGAREIIGKTISNALKAMFVSVGASEEEKRLFRVNFEKVALVRYDFYVWRYNSKSSGLFTTTKGVVAYTYARSVVDHKRVSDDELNDAIEQSMGGLADPAAVLAYKKQLIELWSVHQDTPVEHAVNKYQSLLQSRGLQAGRMRLGW